MIENTPPAQVLQRYLTNTCTDTERAWVEEWYQQLNLQSVTPFTEADKERILENVQGRIALAEHQEEEVRAFPFKSWWRYAGGIAAMLILSFGLIYVLRQQRSTPVAVTDNTMIRYANTSKRIIPYSLPDQTQIWLHPGASVAYHNAFAGRKTREVIFEGEAFFEVARDTTRPFLIRSGEMTTEVLGTSFNVKAYADQPDYRVSVVTGSVSVSASKGKAAKPIILKPQQQAVFEKSTHELTLMDVTPKPAQQESWQPVSMSFTNASLAEITGRLQKTFKVKIRIDNPALLQCSLKADFDDQNLPEILEMINTLMGTTYEIQGEQIVITGEGCENP